MDYQQNLPVELWEKVLGHLPGKHLLEVTLVCKKLYKIIGVSKKLMNRLSLRLTSFNVERIDKCLKQSKREYSNVTIDGLTRVSSDLEKLLRHQSRSIECVKISNCSFTLKRLKHLLDPISSTLRTLTLCNVKLMEECKVNLQLNFSCLRQVCIMACVDNTSVKTLKMICDANIYEFFFMSNIDVNEDEVNILMEFLLTQRRIRSLALTGKAAAKLMRLEKFPTFELETFCIDFARSDAEEVSRFLIEHKESLTYLSLGRMEIDGELIDCLASFNKLKCLRFSECIFKSYQSYAKNNNVRELLLLGISADNDKIICKLLNSMHVVQKINLESFEVTFNVCLSIAYDMKHLARLTLDKCEINPITFMNVKRLKIIGGERDDIIKMILVNRQIEMLEIDRTYQQSADFQDALKKLVHATISFLR